MKTRHNDDAVSKSAFDPFSDFAGRLTLVRKARQSGSGSTYVYRLQFMSTQPNQARLFLLSSSEAKAINVTCAGLGEVMGYVTGDDRQPCLLPPVIDDYVDSNAPVRVIDVFVDGSTS